MKETKEGSGEGDERAENDGVFKAAAKFGIPKDEWNAWGNILMRFGAVMAANSDSPLDETDKRLARLRRLYQEMLKRLGNSPPCLKLHCEE